MISRASSSVRDWNAVEGRLLLMSASPMLLAVQAKHVRHVTARV